MITASTAAGVLGLCPHEGPLATFNRIMGRTTSGDNNHMAWGRENEPRARAAYERQEGVLIEETGFWVHPDLPWLGASPDGLVDDDGVLEIKCPQKPVTACPPHHAIQCRVHMAVCDRDWCHYFSWTPEGVFGTTFFRDREEETRLLAALERFWRAYIKANTPPPRRRPLDGF